MKKVLFVFLISCFSLTVISCSDDKEESTATVAEAEQIGGSMQGGQLSLSTVVTTLAGTGSTGSSNGTGT